MDKTKREFLLISVIVITFSFVSSFGYHKYLTYEHNKKVEQSISKYFSNKESDDINFKLIFKEELRKNYLKNGFNLKNTNFFNKLKYLMGMNEIEKYENENKDMEVKITYFKDKILIEENSNKKIKRKIEYSSEDRFKTVQIKIEDKE